MRETDILHKMQLFFQKHRISVVGRNVLTAVSGGIDSVVLAHLLIRFNKLKQTGMQIYICHINHNIRDESGADERFVQEYAKRLGLPCIVRTIPKGALSGNIEASARKRRYALLAETAIAHGIELIFTGHTRDDAAETVLLRLLRGTGLTGLAGILPIWQMVNTITVVRPLLGVSRAELTEYAEHNKLEFVEDMTNRETTLLRNRIRHRLIPLLEKEYQKGATGALARLSKIFFFARSLHSRIASQLLFRYLVSKRGSVVRLAREISLLSDFELYLLLSRVVDELDGQELTFERFEAIRSLLDKRATGKRIELSCGLSALLEHSMLAIGVMPAVEGTEETRE